MKRLALSCAVAAATILLASQPALAARIYNFLPVRAIVLAHPPVYSAAIAPDGKSDSLSWPAALAVTISVAGKMGSSLPICAVGFGGHADIQGGNYLTIGHQGNTIICTLCNADHARINGNSTNDASKFFDIVKYPSSRTGC